MGYNKNKYSFAEAPPTHEDYFSRLPDNPLLFFEATPTRKTQAGERGGPRKLSNVKSSALHGTTFWGGERCRPGHLFLLPGSAKKNIFFESISKKMFFLPAATRRLPPHLLYSGRPRRTDKNLNFWFLLSITEKPRQ